MPGIKEILKDFREDVAVEVRGRIVSLRHHGKSIFADLRDMYSTIQLYITYDRNPQLFYAFKELKLGDIIYVSGISFLTKTKEPTIKIDNFKLLTKAKYQPPKEFYGLKDIQLRYRQRYLDLLVNQDIKKLFIKRAEILRHVREILNSLNFIEVETPILQPIPGGAHAKPFTTYHEAMDMQLYLRVAPELYLKRLIVGGFERIYELGKNFRNEGVSSRHNPEFTMLEVYMAYSDYNEIASLAQQLVKSVAYKLNNAYIISYQNHIIDLAAPWRRVGFLEIIHDKVGCDVHDYHSIVQACREYNIDTVGKNKWELLDDLLEKVVSKDFIEPTFVVDYPLSLCPLAKRKDDMVCERFELFIGGLEIANAYSELVDADEQAERFKVYEPSRFDADYINALGYGMPPTSGLGIGIDRLVMLLCDAPSIREVLLFPLVKP